MDVVDMVERMEKRVAKLETEAGTKDMRIKQLEAGYAELQKTALEQVDRIESLKKEAAFGTRFRELLQDIVPQASSAPGGLTAASSRPTLDIIENRPPINASGNTDLFGKFGLLISEGWWDDRRNPKQVLEEFNNRGWAAEREDIIQGMIQMCNLNFFYRKISTGNIYWYTITEDAKTRVRKKTID